MTTRPVSIAITGREMPGRLPPLFSAASRGAGSGDDVFLPAGYLEPKLVIDVSPAARGISGSKTEVYTAAPDEVVVLELSDGSTLVTSSERLRDSLARTHPELIADDGSILLEQLRAEASVPGRGFAEVAGGLISKVYAFAVGAAPDAIIEEAAVRLGRKAGLGVSWAGTKALMWAIEKKLDREPGLYRWVGGSGKPSDLEPVPGGGAGQAAGPLLVFVHGTGSSALGSFGDLRLADRDLWGTLQSRFTGGIYAFEHRTLSESPIDNALALARALPRGAQVSLVSHSRGGLVADLLCLDNFDSALIDRYAFDLPGTGDADPAEAERVLAEMREAHAEQRETLRELAKALRDRQLIVERYVRVASPANGTKLASGNFDVFLSSVLTLIGAVPFFFGSPIYAAFKRVVVEIARNRTNPHLVPGIEAMLPDSPMARFLREAPVRAGLEMAVIAGDIQGGNLLKRLGVLLTDFILYDREDNDLVVNTTAMLAGVAPQAGARVLFDRGADVSHFRYFGNFDTRSALRDWLTADQPARLEAFRALPGPDDFAAALAAASASRGIGAADRPIVVVLPGVMGSHLQRGGKDRVWFDPLDIASGGLAKIAWGQRSVEADGLFAMAYGKLCRHLADSHRVEPFPFDWRQPLDVLAERLGEFLDHLLKSTTQPIRLVAHSMGGLVVRACIHKRRPVIDALMARDGARFIMLGTPNQGAHSMVENLIGKGGTLRTLVRLDVRHDMQQVLDIVAGFRGALQLLPKPGFSDTFQGDPNGGGRYAFQEAETWVDLKAKVTDLWFGNQRAGTPSQAVLEEASWLWQADGTARPALPADYAAKCIYVFGVGANTACGIREERDPNGGVRLKMVGTTRGDGTVTWDSGRIDGVGSSYYMPADHGDLLATEEHFQAILDLLTTGATINLSQQPPAVRAIEQAAPITYDAGPPTADDPDALPRMLLGGSLRNRVVPRPKRRLEVGVFAMDLRFVTEPIMVGHYERDPIAGPEALIDRELLDGALGERHRLGLYAGAPGTATVVLRVPNPFERLRGSMSGAVVTGLGSYDRALSPTDLTESVRVGALRYLLQVIDVLGPAERTVPLATLLIGYNSSANLTVSSSVEALVRGVMEANERFHETTRLHIRIDRLDIVELYVDTAITAVYALRQLSSQLAAQAAQQGTMLVCRGELGKGDGLRQRLFDDRTSSYWPRMIIADADRPEDAPVARSAAAAPGGTTAPTGALLAQRLRFVYVGQRARAETIALQRQPGLIETLVAQQIHNPNWDEAFGRMLFQLMVPYDFKDAARKLDRVVLVVDSYTANLPWELMLADDPSRPDDQKVPLALRTAVVRQLATPRFRNRVRQATERRALVVGNPSVAGFTDAFPVANGRPTVAPPPLAGAEAEAEATAAVLTSMGYRVEQVIGDFQPASTVLQKLYEQPWRILHISAHGVFDAPHRDGRRRSGVVLSDGVLITAAEIEAMETVPEVVFLNCCHVGRIDLAVDGNKLAASVARELIEIGVRCVVVAGWAVNDESARIFGQSFYEHLLLARLTFGEAVFEARKATWEASPREITWGAFQAYGEPGWRADPLADGAPASAGDGHFVTPDELLDHLVRVRVELSRRGSLSQVETKAQSHAITTLLKERCPPGWQRLPQLQSALGATWFALGDLAHARDALLAAIQAVDTMGLVPIHDIETLANVEARLGEQRARRDIERGDQRPASEQTAEALIDLALQRLDGLDALVETRFATSDTNGERLDVTVNAERWAIRGSAWKRKASLRARLLLVASLSASQRETAISEMTLFLENGIDAYRHAEGDLGSSDFDPYHALNRLALDALTGWEDEAGRDAALELARQCRAAATRNFEARPDVWNAAMQPEALLVERLIDGSLGKPGDEGHAALEEIAQAYSQALANVTAKPSQTDSIVTQIELLARFCDARSLAQQGNRAALLRTADRLTALVERLCPTRRRRDDRPAGAKAEAPVAAPRRVAKKAARSPARKRSAKKAAPSS